MKRCYCIVKRIVFDALKEVNLTKEDLNRLNNENRIAIFVGNFIAKNCIDQGHLSSLLTEAVPCFYGVSSGRCEVVETGKIAYNGDKSVNPSGGLIGCGHPIVFSGVRMLLDVHKHVTNQAENYQIENAKKV